MKWHPDPILIFVGLFITSVLCGQPMFTEQTLHRDSVTGNWKEVRRETRLGYVFNPNGAQNQPGIEMSFNPDGFGTFYNPGTEVEQVKINYFFLNDSTLAFGRINDVVFLSKDSLVLVMRANNKVKADLDLKCYFIRREVYDSLPPQVIEKLKAPRLADSLYYDSCQRALKALKIPDYVEYADPMPQYPGGDAAFKRYFEKNIKQPKHFNGKGWMLFSFIVETNGKLSSIKLEKGLCPDCDKEAMRVIQAMPDWVPGAVKDEPARVKVFLPVLFQFKRLEGLAEN